VMTPPRAAEALIAACPDATVVQLDGGGHSLMAERPDQVLTALKDFAARTIAPSAAPAG
jgi:pimeloyl-ACP methyl ester carboxylesterase